MQHQKVKSVAKRMHPRGQSLRNLVLNTMEQVASMVGSTLGPGGMPVLIERQEFGLAPMVTKDGVTVFRALGFVDPTAQVIMEAARDAAIRTASEAGDGTTTATVLAEAIVREVEKFCRENPKYSPQRVVRRLQEAFAQTIQPFLTSQTVKPYQKLRELEERGGATEEERDEARARARKILWNVARISANGDAPMADAVMQCFDEVGDEGNVTLQELSGNSGFVIEKIEGYPIPNGYDDTMGKYSVGFVNDPALQRCVLSRPAFLIYNGVINNIQTVQHLMEKVGAAWQETNFRHNIVIAATGFSESVLAQLSLNFADQTCINVVPLLAPLGPTPQYQLDTLLDLCAVTGATLLDPITRPCDDAELDVLGQRAVNFEMQRFRTLVVSDPDDDGDAAILIEDRVNVLKSQKSQAASILDAQFLDERIGKLTNGIAKLTITGPSSGELRERRDRAEDAICAVRGTIKHGAVLGGGWTLAAVRAKVEDAYPGDLVITKILGPALTSPLKLLLENAGLLKEEATQVYDTLLANARANDPQVYDAYQQKFVDGWESGLLDSTPAVLEALRNSLSIASLLGSLGGTVVFARDLELERKEAIDNTSFLKAADYGDNPANDKAM
jgi:chaperonin GroEL